MNFKNEKGAISIFVLLALLFMSTFLIIAYATNINKAKVVKEQFDIVSKIYSPGNDEEESYNKAYTNIRKNSKQTLTSYSEEKNFIELTKTFEGDLSNYRIYGNNIQNQTNEGVGDLVTDTTDSNYGKYKIQIKTVNENKDEQIRYIFLESPLLKSTNAVDYIDFKEGKVYRNVGEIKEEYVELPKILTYEDYTKIEVITNVIPSKIEVEYEGYKI